MSSTPQHPQGDPEVQDQAQYKEHQNQDPDWVDPTKQPQPDIEEQISKLLDIYANPQFYVQGIHDYSLKARQRKRVKRQAEQDINALIQDKVAEAYDPLAEKLGAWLQPEVMTDEYYDHMNLRDARLTVRRYAKWLRELDRIVLLRGKS